MDTIEQDNIIQWIFEKIFDQLTVESAELYITPYDKILSKTFNSQPIYQLINKLSHRNIDIIKEYLTNKQFQEKFLFAKIKKKIHVQILLNDLDKIKYLIGYGYKPDAMALQLVVLNNRLDILKYIIKDIIKDYTKIKPTNDLLMYCAEFGYDDIYFYLRDNGLVPNISIYNKALLGHSIKIITDISENIGLSNKILTTAFQSNHTDIILFLVKTTSQEKIKLCPNLMTYPILNANFNLLKQLEEMNLVNWHAELYYSALLSGSMEMVAYIETKILDLHEKHTLDTSKTRKGQSSLLLEDMVYEVKGKKYFSHCTNYAVQSKSLEIVKYIHSKGYGITKSNILTAIKQGTREILEYLLENYHQIIPNYFIHYFGTNSFIADKMSMAKVLINHGFDLDPKKNMNVNDYKKESIHLEMISQSVQIPEDGQIDPDYLLKYQLFFVPIKGYKLNYRLLTKTRICLELNLDIQLQNIFSSDLNNTDKQFVMDTLFLFGNITQIIKYYPMLNTTSPPSKQILMEIMCYCQINKLCYLIHKHLLTHDLIFFLQPVKIILADQYIDTVFAKIDINSIEPDLKFILLSGKKQLIINYATIHKDKLLTKALAKEILMIADIELIKYFNFSGLPINELIEWAIDTDLLEIANHLKNYYNN